MLTKNQLWQLRTEVPLFSLFVKDYRNSFGIDPDTVCTFFEGYGEYLYELIMSDHHAEEVIETLLPEYDNPENLLDWYWCFEEDPLPIPPADIDD